MNSLNRPELIQDYNLQLVRQALFKLRQATRQTLCAQTGISNVTMGTLLSRLIETGEAIESEPEQTSGGRPAKIYNYNSNLKRGLLILIRGSKSMSFLHSVWINLYGEILWEKERLWEDEFVTKGLDKEKTLEYFRELIRTRGDVQAISVGLPGVGFDSYLHSRHGLRAISLEALNELGMELKIPISVENDVNLMAMGYAARNEISSFETLCYFYLMQGSFGGSGMLVSGKLHLGKGRFAGELLPPPEGADWLAMPKASTAEIREALFNTVLPYLTVLAPHRVVIASDFIDQADVNAVMIELGKLLEPNWMPRFYLTEDCAGDYREGLIRLTLDRLTKDIEQRGQLQ